MTFSRRDFLKLASLIAGSACLSSCGPAYASLARLGEGEIFSGHFPTLGHQEALLLGRISFGSPVSERRRVAAIGLQAWIEEQLAPDSIDDLACALRLRAFLTLRLSAQDLFDLSDRLFDNQDRARVPDELRQATLVRQVYSRRQLYERMVEFWSDHFNISVEKGDCFYLKTVDDREVVRAHALGRFRDLVQASAHSPAMLVYLDNQSNHREAPNENYARELMELHTLGVDGGYTQQDVMELARCLTGWTVKEHFWRGDFTFKHELHDEGVKVVLGATVRPAGQAEAESVLERLAAHPATALFVCRKLAHRFISDSPPEPLVRRAAATFTGSGGDLRAVLRTLLLDGVTFVEPKFKRPVDFVASALRLLGAQTDGGSALQGYLARMGQRYFAWPTPDGPPDRSESWQGNLMPRWQFALALARDEIEGTAVDIPAMLAASGAAGIEAFLDWLGGLLLGGPLPSGARDELVASLRAAGAGDTPETAHVIVAGVLASPMFQWM
jgi:hypothetical protein